MKPKNSSETLFSDQGYSAIGGVLWWCCDDAMMIYDGVMMMLYDDVMMML